jgi:glycosyltransferase involved in cell wall biosynthesis
MSTYVLVTGDFVQTGGMDRANYELAWHLANEGRDAIHLVSHRVASPLAEHPAVRWHRVPKPWNRYAFAAPLLAYHGRRVAAELEGAQPRVIVNGGNCAWPDVTWIHAVHGAWQTRARHAPIAFRMRAAWSKRSARRSERRALAMSRSVITNSERARRDVLAVGGTPPERVRTVYYGVDPETFRPADSTERSCARERLQLPVTRPLIAFVGALGHDRNKGFDVLFEAWQALCADPRWDADLLVVGAGAEVELWRRRSAHAGLERRIRLVGFTSEVDMLLAAADALVSPTHYDGYGLAVHEALCRGLPAFVTSVAGIAERYPAELADLLLCAPPTAADLVKRLRRWRAEMPAYQARVAPFGERLRRRTWRDMARDIASVIEATAAPERTP